MTFPMGGIAPPDRKKDTRHARSRNAIIPPSSIVALWQHRGEPARAVVSAGDRVREGMLIGRAASPEGAHVHAPVPGVVREIRRIELAGGVPTDAVVIDMDGEFDRLGKEATRRAWESLDPAGLLRRIAENGVVNMDGTPIPTHTRFQPSAGGTEYLILNGCESEPYLSADHRLMVEQPAAVLEGALIVARIVGAGRLVVAIEANKPDALAAMRAAVREQGTDARVVRLRVRYPQGDERQLVRAVTGREIPSGGRPEDAGCLTLDVATARAVHEAVVFGQPLVERVLTVSGGAIAKPANIKVRVGTPIRMLLDECGGLTADPVKIVAGGPLTGETVTDLETPVTKSTRGILALTRAEVRAASPRPCIQCGRCVEACPMGLDPSRLYKLIDHRKGSQALAEGLFDCTECGACGYICPSRIPLVQGLRIGKTRVSSEVRGAADA